MATPHVAGAVLLLRQIKPEATVDEIKYALYLTAVDLGPLGEDNSFGMGRIDVVEAANALENGFGTIEGHVRDAVTGAPIEGARVRLEGTSFFDVSDAMGHYSLVATANTTYNASASAFGYRSDTMDSIYLPDDSPVNIDFELEVAQHGILQGTVTDKDNSRPLENVTIYFLNAPIDEVKTNENGFYQIGLPGDYAYDIKASKSDYESEYVSDIYIPEEGLVTQNFELEPESCFFDAAVSGSAVESDLDVYRKARNLLVGGGPLAERLLHLYQEHTAEVAAILLYDQTLRAEVRSMISRFASIVQSIVEGEDLDRPVLSNEDEAEINALLDRIELIASPELKDAIEAIRIDVRTFKDMKVGEVRSLLQ